jgi:hypothetical protein
MPEHRGLVLAADAEKTAEAKHFADVFLLLGLPEARPVYASGLGRLEEPGRIDDYRDNWWCPFDTDVDLDALANIRFQRTLVPRGDAERAARLVAAFSDEERVRGREEYRRLEACGCGLDYLGGETLGYARVHAEDARVPEALHRTVRVGRYSCLRAESPRVARAAFRLLHGRYAKSEWAKKTPTWSDSAGRMYRFLEEGRD